MWRKLPFIIVMIFIPVLRFQNPGPATSGALATVTAPTISLITVPTIASLNSSQMYEGSNGTTYFTGWSGTTTRLIYIYSTPTSSLKGCGGTCTPTWTLLINGFTAATPADFVTTLYVDPGGVVFVGLTNNSTTCDLSYINGSTLTPVTGYTTAGGCNGAATYIYKLTTDGTTTYFASGQTLWKSGGSGSTAFTLISSNVMTAWPAQSSGNIYTILWVAALNQLCLGGESAWVCGNTAWTSGNIYITNTNTNGNLIAGSWVPSTTTFVVMRNNVTGYPPNDCNLYNTSTSTLTQPAGSNPWTTPNCPYFSNNQGLSGSMWIKGTEVFESFRNADSNSGTIGARDLISYDSGATWIDLTTYGTAPAGCTTTTVQVYPGINYVDSTALLLRGGPTNGVWCVVWPIA